MKKSAGRLTAAVAAALMLVSSPGPAAAGGGPVRYAGPVRAENVRLVTKISTQETGTKATKPVAKRVSTGSIGVPGADEGDKAAILIGVSDYPYTRNDLNFADDDALEMKAELMAHYGFLEAHVHLLLDSEATPANIVAEINEVAQAKCSELFFFYSGHGSDGVALDGDANRMDQSIVVWKDGTDAGGMINIWDGELRSWFDPRTYPVKNIIFAFDSCLSGGMVVLNAPGRVVNMACSATGYSYESTKWGDGNGQFTYYFGILGLGGGEADAYALRQDGLSTVEEAFDYAKAMCTPQKPVVADGVTDDIVP